MLLALSLGAAQAQDGFFDATWGNGGRLLIAAGGEQDAIHGAALRVLPDGRLLLAGTCQMQIGGVASETLCALRRQRNGGADFSFGPNETGRVLLGEMTGFPREVGMAWHGLSRLPDGQLILGGTRQLNTCDPGWPCAEGLLVRLSADGVPQPVGDDAAPFQRLVFSSHERSPFSTIAALASTADGRIVAVGSSHRAGSDQNAPDLDFAIARLLPDLSLDATFAGGGVRLAAFDLGGTQADAAAHVLLQPDGKMIVVGQATTGPNSSALALLRLNPDGSSDPGFGNFGRVWLEVSAPRGQALYAGALDRQGRILAAGGWQLSGDNFMFIVARWLPNGSLDTGFGTGGWRTVGFAQATPAPDIATSLALQSDGKILLAGQAGRSGPPDFHSYFAVARLTANGDLDTSFGNSGRTLGTFAPGAGLSDAATALIVGNGGLMIAGLGGDPASQLPRFGLARLQLDLIHHDGFQPP